MLVNLLEWKNIFTDRFACSWWYAYMHQIEFIYKHTWCKLYVLSWL